MEDNPHSGIPDDLAERIRKDDAGEEKALAHWRGIMEIDCPDLGRDARIDLLRDMLEENPWLGFDELHGMFASHVRELEYLKKLESWRDILVEIERMIGSSCYNGNIQNYSSWGVFDSQGRSFRYPLTYHDETGAHKCKFGPPATLPMKPLMGAYYAFGANQLNVMEATLKILLYFKSEFGLDLSKRRGK